MKFEITYQDASKVTLEVPDADVKAWLDARAKQKALASAEKTEQARGSATTVKVV